MIKILFTISRVPQKIMDFDKELLNGLNERSLPTLHFYSWPPSITYGHFIDIDKHLNIKKITDQGICLARRPTGGGIVFHMWDMAFSFLLPSHHKRFSTDPLDNYHFVNGSVLDAVKKKFELSSLEFKHEKMFSNFCMANPTKYDLIVDGKKIAGAAQRMTKRGYLHQGTIALIKPKKDLLDSIVLDEKTKEGIIANSFGMHIEDLAKTKRELIDLLIESFLKTLF